MEIISCIYTITNLVNNKIYLGYAKNFDRRKKKHRVALRGNKHPNGHLQEAWNKYGENNFTFEILTECNIEFLASEEYYWATLLNVHNRKFGYNILPTHPYKLNSGHSYETCKKISKATKGRTMSEENKIKMSKRTKGIKWKEESIVKRLKTFKENGYKISENTKNKISNTKLSRSPYIVQYSKDGKFIKKWENMREINNQLNIKLCGIYSCVNKKSKSSNGYIWKYEEKTINYE